MFVGHVDPWLANDSLRHPSWTKTNPATLLCKLEVMTELATYPSSDQRDMEVYDH